MERALDFLALIEKRIIADTSIGIPWLHCFRQLMQRSANQEEWPYLLLWLL
jgi:transposase